MIFLVDAFSADRSISDRKRNCFGQAGEPPRDFGKSKRNHRMNTNCVSRILAVIAVAAAITVASQTASATAIPYELVLTEVSSTVLTYTYSNPTDPTPFTVNNVFKDIWNITINPQSG